MQVQGQNELVETLCRRLQHMEQEYAAALSAAAAAAAPGDPENLVEADSSNGNPDAAGEGTGVAREAAAPAAAPPRRRASTGPTFQIGGELQSPYHNFGSGPGMRRRMSSISIAAAAGLTGPAGSGFGGTSVPTASIDMSDLNNLVSVCFWVLGRRVVWGGCPVAVDMRRDVTLFDCGTAPCLPK